MEAHNSLNSYTPTEELARQPWVEKLSLGISSTQTAMWEVLGWLFNLGSSPGMPFYEQKNLTLRNCFSFVSLLLAFPGTFLLMLFSFAHPFSLLVCGMLAASLVLGLDGARQVEASKALFAFSPAVLVLTFTFLELNSAGGEHSLLLILSRQGLGLALLLPILTYGFAERQKVVGILGMCVVIYLVYEAGTMRLGALQNEELTGLTHGLFAILSVMQYTVLAACILYVQRYTLQQEAQAKRANQKLQRQAIRDGLTGLFNHAFMDGLIGDAINRARRSKTPVALLMIDVDNFKLINDNLGHNAGDEALKEIVKVLSSNKRSTDYLGRWGGDEIIMLLTDTDLPGASHLAEKLRSLIDTHSFRGGMHITISLGTSQYQEGDTPVSFVERADAAMYRAKRGGRNRVEAQKPVIRN